MIRLTRLSGTTVFINCEQIRFVEQCPDTVIVFADGKTTLVRESPDEVARLVIDYRRQLASASQQESKWTSPQSSALS